MTKHRTKPKICRAIFDKAIELDPKDANAYYNRGLAKSELKQYKEAIADYDKAIELNPKDAAAYYNRGVGKKEEAAKI